MLRNVFDEIIFNIPDKTDQQSLRLIVDHLVSIADRPKTDQNKLISKMRIEVEELQSKVRHGQNFHDELKRHKDIIAN
jgi:hypothetical protein